MADTPHPEMFHCNVTFPDAREQVAVVFALVKGQPEAGEPIELPVDRDENRGRGVGLHAGDVPTHDELAHLRHPLDEIAKSSGREPLLDWVRRRRA